MSEYHPGQGFSQPGPYNQPPQYGQGFGPNPNVYNPNPAMYGQGFNQSPGFGGSSGWDTPPTGNQYHAPATFGSWDTQPTSGVGANQYVAPPAVEVNPPRQGIISRIKSKMGGNASHGVVDAAPDVTPSPWGGATEQGGWNTQPTAGYRFDQSGPLPSGSFVESPGYTPDRFRQGVQGFRGFVEQAGGAAQVTGQKAAELWGKTPEPVRVVAGAAGEAAVASFMGNYGVRRSGGDWEVNKRVLATNVVKTAFLPGSTAQLVNQGRTALKAGRKAGRDAAGQQARDAIRRAL